MDQQMGAAPQQGLMGPKAPAKPQGKASQDPSFGTEDASKEEQDQYEQGYDLAMRALHSGKTAKNTVGRILDAETPAKGVAEAVFVLIRKTEVKLGGIEDSVKVELAEDLTMEVLDLMVESGRMTEGETSDELIEEIVKELYMRYAADAEERGGLDEDKIREDIEASGQPMPEGQMPQGSSAMSNQEVESRGLMNV